MGFFKSISNIVSGKVAAGNSLQESMFILKVRASDYKKKGNDFMSSFYDYMFGQCFSYAGGEFETCYQLPGKYVRNIDDQSSILYMQMIVALQLKYYLDVSGMKKYLMNINMTEEELMNLIFKDINVEKENYSNFRILSIDFSGDLSMYWTVWTRQLMKIVYKQPKSEVVLDELLLDSVIRQEMFDPLYDRFAKMYKLPNPNDYLAWK